MEKRHISGHDVVEDIHSGMDDLALMEKYKLSPRELDLLMKKLAAAKLVDQAEVSELQLLWAQKRGTVWHCPACHMPQSHAFEECPQCGIVTAKFKEKGPREQEVAGKKDEEDQEFIEVPPAMPVETTGPPDKPATIEATPAPPLKCPGCSMLLPQDAKFCPSCGIKVSAPAPA
jgi:uncharacterized paraquat-inducible protein A